MEEARIIQLVRAGNKDAFAQIVERYQAPIFRYLYRLTGDFEMAQDLAQDTFLQAYKSILRTNTELSLKAWLYRIATNNVLRQQRRQRFLRFFPFRDHGRRRRTPADREEDLTERLAIQEALLEVPERERACLVLHFVEGLKYREIAEAMGISEEAVRKRVARGKEMFRRLYAGGNLR